MKNKLGADEGSRTPTPKALDPKSSASANSATSAHFSLFCWWRMVDSNHRSRWQQIYSLPPLAAREILHMELVIGIEPTTCWLQVSCSTVEPHQHSVYLMATWKGLEPSTSSVTGWHSNQLNYQAAFIGGSNRARTCDPLLVRQMLSQLSYTPTSGAGEGDRTLTAGLEGQNSTIELHPHI